MENDELKRAWQAQTSQGGLTMDAEQLLAEVRRKESLFHRTIFWRDVREVGTALLMVPLWVYLGVKNSSPWTWYLMLPALLWVAGFMLMDRARQRRLPPDVDNPIRSRLESLLAQVEHQIGLLRYVHLWYLLPLALPALAFFGQVAWHERAGGWWTALSLSLVIALGAGVFIGIYWLNQFAVRCDLEPRRRELEGMLLGLKDETTTTR